MINDKYIDDIISRYGGEILSSAGMQAEKNYVQHGTNSVYDHSLKVARLSIRLAVKSRLRVDMRSLVRGALLHDYFLYDWHIPDKNRRQHAFCHAGCALKNATRDFELNRIEKNAIRAHMFPLVPIIPRFRESIIVCVADKLSATFETVSGMRLKLARKGGAVAL